MKLYPHKFEMHVHQQVVSESMGYRQKPKSKRLRKRTLLPARQEALHPEVAAKIAWQVYLDLIHERSHEDKWS